MLRRGETTTSDILRVHDRGSAAVSPNVTICHTCAVGSIRRFGGAGRARAGGAAIPSGGDAEVGAELDQRGDVLRDLRGVGVHGDGVLNAGGALADGGKA